MVGQQGGHQQEQPPTINNCPSLTTLILVVRPFRLAVLQSFLLDFRLDNSTKIHPNQKPPLNVNEIMYNYKTSHYCCWSHWKIEDMGALLCLTRPTLFQVIWSTMYKQKMVLPFVLSTGILHKKSVTPCLVFLFNKLKGNSSHPISRSEFSRVPSTEGCSCDGGEDFGGKRGCLCGTSILPFFVHFLLFPFSLRVSLELSPIINQKFKGYSSLSSPISPLLTSTLSTYRLEGLVGWSTKQEGQICTFYHCE